MELTRFDLLVIKDALLSIVQREGNLNVFRKSAYQNTKSAIADILSEYPSANVFLVQPDELEE